MTRPTLLKLAERTLREDCGVRAGERLLLAVSGGPDSMALLHVCATLAPRLRWQLRASGVDHGLRADAAAELDLAERAAAALDVPFQRHRVQVEPGGNLHARARDARYALLERARLEAGADYLVTAHHADDRAETVLIRLLSGSGPKGLAVLPARAGVRLRPLIRARRLDILTHLRRHSIPSMDDPSNKDSRFLRTRVRHELLPLLEDISPGIVGHLTALADEIAAPELPQLLDPDGNAVELRRSHRQQLRHALRHQLRDVVVLIGEGRAITLDPRSGQPTVVLCGPAPGTPHGRDAKLRPLGLKTHKSD